MGKTKVNKIRLTFEFSPEAVKELEELQRKLDFPCRVDVIRQAMGLLIWAIKERQDGWELVVRRGDEEQFVVLPGATLSSKSA